MRWRKMAESGELISYEKSSKSLKVGIEARARKQGWLVYKTYNFLVADAWQSHVNEYVAGSLFEAKSLISELLSEDDISLENIGADKGLPEIRLRRVYKEGYIEKWQIAIGNDGAGNFATVIYDEGIRIDIVLHDRYNPMEKEIITKIIEYLGLKTISDVIRYDFFYYKKHSAKRRVYERKENSVAIARVEFGVSPSGVD